MNKAEYQKQTSQVVGAAFSKAAIHRDRSLLRGLFYFDAAPKAESYPKSNTSKPVELNVL